MNAQGEQVADKTPVVKIISKFQSKALRESLIVDKETLIKVHKQIDRDNQQDQNPLATIEPLLYEQLINWAAEKGPISLGVYAKTMIDARQAASEAVKQYSTEILGLPSCHLKQLTCIAIFNNMKCHYWLSLPYGLPSYFDKTDQPALKNQYRSQTALNSSQLRQMDPYYIMAVPQLFPLRAKPSRQLGIQLILICVLVLIAIEIFFLSFTRHNSFSVLSGLLVIGILVFKLFSKQYLLLTKCSLVLSALIDVIWILSRSTMYLDSRIYAPTIIVILTTFSLLLRLILFALIASVYPLKPYYDYNFNFINWKVLIHPILRCPDHVQSLFSTKSPKL